MLYEWPGVVVLLVLGIGLTLSFRRNRADSADGDQARVRTLLTTYGGSSFSYMTLWPGNSAWFTPDGRGAVAYRVVGTVAVTTGDPVGAPDALADAVRLRRILHRPWQMAGHPQLDPPRREE